ncbi:class E sortase [Actinacidiphila sp. ITFR-21]|uniref:class E sortase n=1 Tax=Actinacidiphila sp. ITFR-21 TaxID=3075199 RepID=UPI00288BCC50|nr:class E sortase [Streptomyces sp. ITFR-21]WNI16689.1 class E sortase [Streptomyces sp. ITFR-21]
MTTLRPERPADGPMSYEDTGQFAAVVQQLADPLNDPLPGRPPAVSDEEPDGGAGAAAPEAPAPGRTGAPARRRAAAPAPVPGPPPTSPARASSPQAAPPQVSSSQAAAPEVRREAPPAAPPPPYYGRPLVTDLPSAPANGSPWFRPPEPARGLAPAPEQPPVREERPVERPVRGERPPVREQAVRTERFGAPEAVPAEPYAAPEAVSAEPYAPPEPVPAEPNVPPETEPPAREAFVPPEPVQSRQAARRALAETAKLPVIQVPPPTAVEPQAGGGAQPAGTDAGFDGAPTDGGRAARRKAARGGHRARGRAGTGPAAGSAPSPAGAGASSPAEPSAPLSRVEARRAAKAAKESPSVVISRIVGELFITIGVIMLLFVTYQLWWTNVRAHQQANSASNKLEQQWQTTTGGPDRAAGTFSPGQGFAIMYIPKLDVKAPIAQGVDKTSVLDKGMIGHYDGDLNTAMPWDRSGNFAVAAHRNTHGEPFRYINHLVPGDKVVVETATTYYTYQVTSSLASTPPSNIGVLQPVPPGSGFTTAGRYLTLTTCTPEFTSTNRLIVWGKLIEERPRSKGKPDALVGG